LNQNELEKLAFTPDPTAKEADGWVLTERKDMSLPDVRFLWLFAGFPRAILHQNTHCHESVTPILAVVLPIC
jgi:hypothetical protein